MFFGVFVCAGGIVYAVITGVALPDQDPTPAMKHLTAFHMRIADTAIWIGMVLIVLSMFASCVLAGSWMMDKLQHAITKDRKNRESG